MNYLGLVNLVIQESGKEMTDLTEATWSSGEAGRRLYPRIKRYVAQAWKTIQMSRDQWEFNTIEFSLHLYPRMLFVNGDGTPFAAGAMTSDTSLTPIVVRDYGVYTGDVATGEATGWVEFTSTNIDNILLGEEFVDADSSFEYAGPAGYFLNEVTEISPEVADQLQWTNLVASRDDGFTSPVVYIPWSQWLYKESKFYDGAQLPRYVSQNPMGQLVFYPQPVQPFRLHAVASLKPQELTEWDDEPSRIPEEYHEWIAWEALMRLASFDKNPQLYAHAQKHAMFFKLRAEKNLMPMMSWSGNKFNE